MQLAGIRGGARQADLALYAAALAVVGERQIGGRTAWDAEIRSCSSPVLVHKTTEQVMSVHPILVSLASDAKIGEWTWGLQP
jgi:hypothetical protein